ncbi:MAG TPA: hypothetical protein PLR76_03605 [Hyphomonas sp.]|nr:hypothetical protein [Hyphomonas sp.]MCA8906228.1 hypothetical protein [Hyphomonas sp.]MCB9962559.1 hypothetical protein [Hyphomonas sp.]MCB9971989.1 hypothetical protein [Hyphomonas sp.]HPE47450.1 hypothetical protein [Hyphomonas sp.]
MTRLRRSLSLLVAMGTLAACGGHGGAPPDTSRITATDIRPTDFVLLPCPVSTAEAPCIIIAAGGKRVLAGAPAGLRAVLGTVPGEAANLDAVLLFSLQAQDIEGLDEVRNVTWTAGREGPLPVAGPSGTRDMLAALNKMYELSDAEIFVNTPPRGGFDAAPLGLLPGEGDAKTRVFDTGDLVITKIETAGGRAGYWIDYGGLRAVIQPCGMDQAVRFAESAGFVVSCDGGAAAWPFSEPQYLLQGREDEDTPEKDGAAP